jgi:hypothetical protein
MSQRPITRDDNVFWWENITIDTRTNKQHIHNECSICQWRGIIRPHFFDYCNCVFWEIEREKIMSYYKSTLKEFKHHWDVLLLNAYVMRKFSL